MVLQRRQAEAAKEKEEEKKRKQRQRRKEREAEDAKPRRRTSSAVTWAGGDEDEAVGDPAPGGEARGARAGVAGELLVASAVGKFRRRGSRRGRKGKVSKGIRDGRTGDRQQLPTIVDESPR